MQYHIRISFTNIDKAPFLLSNIHQFKYYFELMNSMWYGNQILTGDFFLSSRWWHKIFRVWNRKLCFWTETGNVLVLILSGWFSLNWFSKRQSWIFFNKTALQTRWEKKAEFWIPDILTNQTLTLFLTSGRIMY